jgi:hypothetical protein
VPHIGLNLAKNKKKEKMLSLSVLFCFFVFLSVSDIAKSAFGARSRFDRARVTPSSNQPPPLSQAFGLGIWTLDFYFPSRFFKDHGIARNSALRIPHSALIYTTFPCSVMCPGNIIGTNFA